MMIGLPLAAWMIRQLEIHIASELVVRLLITNRFGKQNSFFDLVFTDDSGIPATIDDFTINILDEPEDPQIKSATSFSRNLNEGDDTETKQDFIPVVIDCADDEDDGSSISWRYTTNNTHNRWNCKIRWNYTNPKCLAEWFYSR